MTKIGVGVGVGVGVGGAPNILAKSIFLSNGIIENNKIKSIIGSAHEPSLVDSNCLNIAVNDTISFTSLAGWSIVSKMGTATIGIVGNTVKCTGAGTLYNMVLSDGTNQHQYPLAEGGHTIAFDTYATPSHGTIACASLSWGLQREYHKNVEGFTTRIGIDTFKQSVFVDVNSDNIPDGWVNTWGNSVITTSNNIVRVTKGNSIDYYRFSLYRNATVISGKTYFTTIRARANNSLILQLRIRNITTFQSVTLTTEWQTLTCIPGVSTNTDFGLVCQNGVQGDWFEFDYVYIQESTPSHKVPKSLSSNLDAQGNSIAILGNGYFIDCETKLLFPSNAQLQAVDDHMEFFYNKYGQQKKYLYSELNHEPFGFGRVFITKTSGRVTKFVVVNPQKFTRLQFINYLTSVGESSYSYRRITNGAFVFFSLGSMSEGDTMSNYFYSSLNARGIKKNGNGNNITLDAQVINDIGLARIANGNLMYTQPREYGVSSFEVIAGEETEFAAEIASGDLVVIDVPGGKRGAYAKCNYPNFLTVGTLVTSTKQIGTTLFNNNQLYNSTFLSYAKQLWIPSGQSGVPAALCDKPLSIPFVGSGAYMGLLFKGWKADELFGVTFTNTDSINIYILSQAQYMDNFSVAGLKCVFKHNRNFTESFNPLFRNSGYLEHNLGDLMGAAPASKALWDAGMLFGSSGNLIDSMDRTILFNNQNNPREWCGFFGQTLWSSDGLTTILNTNLPLVASKNKIPCGNMIGWNVDTTAKLDSILAKCDELGILFLSPLDLIKNMQFNDYVITDFYKA